MKLSLSQKIAFVIFMFAQNATAQDLHFSQFYMAPQQINPSNIGNEFDVRGLANYKNQWNKTSLPFTTVAASFDMNLKDVLQNTETGFWAVGINFFQDATGNVSKITTTNAALVGAYHVYINDQNTIGLGVQTSYFYRTFKINNLQWGTQFDGSTYDPALNSNETLSNSDRLGSPDLGTGVTWTYKKGEHYMTSNDQLLVTAGLSMMNILKPNYAYTDLIKDKLHNRYAAHASALIGIPNTDFSLTPNVLYMLQGGSKELLIGTNVVYKLRDDSRYTGFVKNASVALGGLYRNKDAIILTSMIEYDSYAIGISYDFNWSKLQNATNRKGGFEIALRYVLPNPFSSGGRRSRF